MNEQMDGQTRGRRANDGRRGLSERAGPRSPAHSTSPCVSRSGNSGTQASRQDAAAGIPPAALGHLDRRWRTARRREARSPGRAAVAAPEARSSFHAPGPTPCPATRHTPAPPATRRPCEPGSPGTVTRGASLCGRLVFLGAVSSVLSPWRDFLPPPGRPSSIAGHGRWALPGCRDAAWNAGAQTPVPSPRVPACGDLARRPPGRERAGRRSERGLLCRSR